MSALSDPFGFPVIPPNSALSFNDLLVRVSEKLGLAYYGTTGNSTASPPTNAHDLQICSNVVNDAIRMFIQDGPPPDGWTWQRPICMLDVWPTLLADSSSVSLLQVLGYDGTGTTMTAVTTTGALVTTGYSQLSGPFYPSMELRQLFYGGNPPAGTLGYSPPTTGTLATTTGTGYAILSYLSPTAIYVQGNVTATTSQTSATYSVVSTGDFTLPADFGGQYSGTISYIQNTNRGVSLHWTAESLIRARRSNYNLESGTPFECAVRLIPTIQYNILGYMPPRRRWELMTWRIPNEVLHMYFGYELMFTMLSTANTIGGVYSDQPPSPFSFDNALMDACMAQAEYQRDDSIQGPCWMNYKSSSLPAARQIDGRAKPRNLGYNGDPSSDSLTMGEAIDRFRNLTYQRPAVGYNPAVT